MVGVEVVVGVWGSGGGQECGGEGFFSPGAGMLNIKEHGFSIRTRTSFVRKRNRGVCSKRLINTTIQVRPAQRVRGGGGGAAVVGSVVQSVVVVGAYVRPSRANVLCRYKVVGEAGSAAVSFACQSPPIRNHMQRKCCLSRWRSRTRHRLPR